MTFQYFGPLKSNSRLYQARTGQVDGEEIQDLSRYLVKACLAAVKNGAQKYFMINASSQSGKTSTLLDIAERIKAIGGYACWVDFQRVSGAAPELSINFMAREIVGVLPGMCTSTVVPEKFENDGFGFDHWLWQLPIPKDKPVVILLEEMAALPVDSRQRLMGLLRGAFGGRLNHPWNRVVIIFFGGIELYDMVSTEVSPLHNICENIALADLDLNATQAIIRSGFGKVGNFKAAKLNELGESIYEQASGQPFLTQYLGEMALKLAHKKGDLPIDIQPLIRQLNLENSNYFLDLYKAIKQHELIEVTKSLLQQPTKHIFDKNAISKLRLLGILSQKADRGLAFRNHLIQISLEIIVTVQPKIINHRKQGQYENEIFVSYAWGNESERAVDDLERVLAERGIRIIRDKKSLCYKGSIEEFEQRIGRGQCIILVISDKYLRSEHCMYELVEIAKNRDFRDRIFPIVLEDTHIYRASDRLDYIKYWEEQIVELDQKIRGINLMTNLAEINADLDKYARIRANFDHLTKLLSDMNALTPDIHAASGYTALISAIEAAQKQI